MTVVPPHIVAAENAPLEGGRNRPSRAERLRRIIAAADTSDTLAQAVADRAAETAATYRRLCGHDHRYQPLVAAQLELVATAVAHALADRRAGQR